MIWGKHIYSTGAPREKPALSGYRDRVKGLSEFKAPSFSWASMDTTVDFLDDPGGGKFILELEAQVLDYANRPTSLNGFGEVFGSHIRLRGLGIPFNQLSHICKEAGRPGSWLQPSHDARSFVDFDVNEKDWNLLTPKLILLCLRARVKPGREDCVMGWINRMPFAGRNAGSGSEESSRSTFTSLCRRAWISSESAIQVLKSSSNIDKQLGKQYCLMLLPTGTESGQFYRIGLYVEECFLFGLSKWKVMTVTVV